MIGGPALRDIHLPAEPSWWPPPVAAWGVAAVLLLVMAVLLRSAWRRWQRVRRRRGLATFFDTQVGHAADDVGRLQAASACLRRAVAQLGPAQAALAGESWLAVLDDGRPGQAFTRGAGRLLLDGPYRASLAAPDVHAALDLARSRFIELGMRGNA